MADSSWLNMWMFMLFYKTPGHWSNNLLRESDRFSARCPVRLFQAVIPSDALDVGDLHILTGRQIATDSWVWFSNEAYFFFTLCQWKETKFERLDNVYCFSEIGISKCYDINKTSIDLSLHLRPIMDLIGNLLTCCSLTSLRYDTNFWTFH